MVVGEEEFIDECVVDLGGEGSTSAVGFDKDFSELVRFFMSLSTLLRKLLMRWLTSFGGSI